MIVHSQVDGAVSYLVDHPRAGQLPCRDLTIEGVCIVTFIGSPPGCDVTLRAVDSDGRAGERSRPFCVFGLPGRR